VTQQDITSIREPLGEICKIPDHIISVYSLEKHIWKDSNSTEAIKEREPEIQTIIDFQIDPVRYFLNDILRNIAAPYKPEDRSNTIGQGYWIQAEFGSGKSHLMCFLGALALGSENAWNLIKEKEEKIGRGRRESLYQFWENGLKQKNQGSNKGIFVIVKTLVGSGGGTIGLAESRRSFTEYILEAAKDQIQKELGKNISLYPAELLVDRFLKNDLERYSNDLRKFLKDPIYFEEDEYEDLNEFIKNMQENKSPDYKKSCGNKLWKFYTDYLKVRPQIDAETEDILRHLVISILDEGYSGVLFLIDEVSLFMKDRDEKSRSDDEKTLVVLSNRLAKVDNLPVWTVCAAQQAIEARSAGTKNIIAEDRLKLVPLLNEANDYYKIVLSRVREITNPKLIGGYYNYYRRGFSWPTNIGQDEFERFFPFHKTGIEVLRDITHELTTARSAIHFMYQTLKLQIKKKNNELIRIWDFFDEALVYEEDPSGVYAGLVAIKTSKENEYKIYETCKTYLNEQTKGVIKVHREKAIKILQVLFLYYIAHRKIQGLTAEEVANEILIEKNSGTTLNENIEHYEYILDALRKELRQIIEEKDEEGKSRYRFNPVSQGIDPREVFNKAKNEVESSEKLQKEAWDYLLEFREWPLKTRMMTLDLSYGNKSIFSDIASNTENIISINWQNGEILGLSLEKDLTKYLSTDIPFPTIKTDETDYDFLILIGKNSLDDSNITKLLTTQNDPRIIIWAPGEIKQEEQELLINFAAYRKMINDWNTKESEDAKIVIQWVSDQLRTEIGKTLQIVSAQFDRGKIDALNNRNMSFQMVGEFEAIISPIVDKILATVYESKIISYPQNTPFQKEEATKVINGIVTKGSIPRDIKLGKNESAAQNFGSALMITSSSNWRQLDTTSNPFIDALWKFIDSNITDNKQSIKLQTIYKNFMGIKGYEGKNFGLTKHVIQIYLLCLVKQGKIKINLTQKSGLTSEYIDYSNISQTEFNARILSGFIDIVKMIKPENWEILRPYLGVLIGEEIPFDCTDEKIVEYREKLNTLFKTEKEIANTLVDRTNILFNKIYAINPYSSDIANFKKLFNHELGEDEINGALYALKIAFNYDAFETETSSQSEIDDLKIKFSHYKNMKTFMENENDLLLANTYRKYDFPKITELNNVITNIELLDQKFNDLTPYIDSKVKLKTELIGDSLKITGNEGTLYYIIADYLALYKTMHEYTLSEIEKNKNAIENFTKTQKWIIVTELQKIESLQPKIVIDIVRKIDEEIRSLNTCSDPSIASLETKIKTYPEHDCGLSFTNYQTKINYSKTSLESIEKIVSTGTTHTFIFFLSPTIKEKLSQGKDDESIKSLINCKDEDQLIKFFSKYLTKDKDLINKINKFLKQLKMRTIKLDDFNPSITLIEEDQIDKITEEFSKFLADEFKKIELDKNTLKVLKIE
jgi:hypothetical protein